MARSSGAPPGGGARAAALCIGFSWQACHRLCSLCLGARRLRSLHACFLSHHLWCVLWVACGTSLVGTSLVVHIVGGLWHITCGHITCGTSIVGTSLVVHIVGGLWHITCGTSPAGTSLVAHHLLAHHLWAHHFGHITCGTPSSTGCRKLLVFCGKSLVWVASSRTPQQRPPWALTQSPLRCAAPACVFLCVCGRTQRSSPRVLPTAHCCATSLPLSRPLGPVHPASRAPLLRVLSSSASRCAAPLGSLASFLQCTPAACAPFLCLAVRHACSLCASPAALPLVM